MHEIILPSPFQPMEDAMSQQTFARPMSSADFPAVGFNIDHSSNYELSFLVNVIRRGSDLRNRPMHDGALPTTIPLHSG